MNEGQEDRVCVLKILFRLSFALFAAGLAAGLAELSYLKAINNISASGQHLGTFAVWMLLVASPAIRFLQSKSLWELVPAFQIGTPFSASNVPFWISIFILVRVIRIAVGHLNFGGDLGHKSGNVLGTLWRTHFLHPGPVTNYLLMINGPVTNSITAQKIGSINQQALQFPPADVESDRIARDLERLLQAITSEGKLPESRKKEASELISTIAEEVKRPEKERKPAVIKAMLNAIPIVISTAKSLVELWGEIQPGLTSFFL